MVKSENTYMELALEEAHHAEKAGEVPIGAVLVDKNGHILAKSGNRTLRDHDPCGHAEIIVLRQGAKLLGSPRLPDCDLYVTLEPCAMCAAAISQARIRRLYYGAVDIKGGAVESGVRFFAQSICHHKPEIYDGIGGHESSQLLKAFFKKRR